MRWAKHVARIDEKYMESFGKKTWRKEIRKKI
jgi:hypothetical protein